MDGSKLALELLEVRRGLPASLSIHLVPGLEDNWARAIYQAPENGGIVCLASISLLCFWSWRAWSHPKIRKRGSTILNSFWSYFSRRLELGTMQRSNHVEFLRNDSVSGNGNLGAIGGIRIRRQAQIKSQNHEVLKGCTLVYSHIFDNLTSVPCSRPLEALRQGS